MFEVRLPGGMGTVAPYMVRIENGPRMLVRKDSEQSIRKAPEPAPQDVAQQQQQIADLQAKQDQAVADGEYHKAYQFKTQIDQLTSGGAASGSADTPE